MAVRFLFLGGRGILRVVNENRSIHTKEESS